MFRYLAAAAILATGSSAAPQQSAPPIVVSPPRLKEWIGTAVKTSGADFVGLSGGKLKSVLSTGLIHVAGLRPSDRYVCVYIERASGLYTARFVERRNTGAQTASFLLDSKVLAGLQARKGEFAIRAQGSATSSCNANSAYLPVALDSPLAGDQFLLVNSQTASAMTVYSVDGQKLKCIDLSNALGDRQLIARSFDKICKVPRISCNAEAELTLMRRNGLEFWPAVRQKLRGSCP